MNYTSIEEPQEEPKITSLLMEVERKLKELETNLSKREVSSTLRQCLIYAGAKSSVTFNEEKLTFKDIFLTIHQKNKTNTQATEALQFRDAILYGQDKIEEDQEITLETVLKVNEIVEPSLGSIRKISGYSLIDRCTNKPLENYPRTYEEIMDALEELLVYINNKNDNVNPLIKMLMIIYYIQEISPFYDGNERTGRIIASLYAKLAKIYSLPYLNLSLYPKNNIKTYYGLISEMRNGAAPVNYLVFMLQGMSASIDKTITFIDNYYLCKEKFDLVYKESCPDFYNDDLVNYIFSQSYLQNCYFRNIFNFATNTASRFMVRLVKAGLLQIPEHDNPALYKNVYLHKLFEQTFAPKKEELVS